MLVFVDDGALGRELIPRLASDAPAALIDLAACATRAPRVESEAARFEHVRACLMALADAHEANMVRRLVIVVRPDERGLAPRLAFWARRRAAQRVFLVRDPAAPDDAARRLLAADPAWELKPWEPETPRLPSAGPQPRLELTFPTPVQCEEYYHAIIGTSMFDNLLWEGPSKPDDLIEWYMGSRRSWALGPAHNVSFAIVERASRIMIGGCSWRPNPLDIKRGTIGYTLVPAWQGRGYGTEAIRTLVEWIFRDRGADRVEADVFIGNVISRRLLERLGFEFEAIRRWNALKRGARRDEWLMALTRPRWEQLNPETGS